MKMISANKLNRLWRNGVVAKMVAKTKVLKTIEEISANTSAENVAGATAVKELNNKLTQVRTYVGEDGKLHSVDGTGADTVLPFNAAKAFWKPGDPLPDFSYNANTVKKIEANNKYIYIQFSGNNYVEFDFDVTQYSYAMITAAHIYTSIIIENNSAYEGVPLDISSLEGVHKVRIKSNQSSDYIIRIQSILFF